MRANKYSLESWVSSLPFWHSTPSQISDGTTSDLNFLTAAHSQDRTNVGKFLHGGAIVGLSIAIC
jgi:hypothetical protein